MFPKKLENEKGFVYSAPFASGGAPWRIMLFPHGNSVEYLSVYVDLADAQLLSSIRQQGGRQGAVFQFTVVNVSSAEPCVTSSSEWSYGWWNFLTLMVTFAGRHVVVLCMPSESGGTLVLHSTPGCVFRRTRYAPSRSSLTSVAPDMSQDVSPTLLHPPPSPKSTNQQ